MNDNDIIKALGFCESPDCECTSLCPMFYNGTNCISDCRGELHKNALDLINRQKAEIERLTKDNERVIKNWHILDERTKERYADLYEQAKGVVKADAIKEFATTLIEDSKRFFVSTPFIEHIDDLAKEMTGDK